MLWVFLGKMIFIRLLTLKKEEKFLKKSFQRREDWAGFLAQLRDWECPGALHVRTHWVLDSRWVLWSHLEANGKPGDKEGKWGERGTIREEWKFLG